MITLGQVTIPPKVQKFPTQGVSIKRMGGRDTLQETSSWSWRHQTDSKHLNGKRVLCRKHHHEHHVAIPAQINITFNRIVKRKEKQTTKDRTKLALNRKELLTVPNQNHKGECYLTKGDHVKAVYNFIKLTKRPWKPQRFLWTLPVQEKKLGGQKKIAMVGKISLWW